MITLLHCNFDHWWNEEHRVAVVYLRDAGARLILRKHGVVIYDLPLRCPYCNRQAFAWHQDTTTRKVMKIRKQSSRRVKNV